MMLERKILSKRFLAISTEFKYMTWSNQPIKLTAEGKIDIFNILIFFDIPQKMQWVEPIKKVLKEVIADPKVLKDVAGETVEVNHVLFGVHNACM